MLFVEINSQWRLVQVCVKQFGEGKDKDTETLTTLSVITIQFTSVLFCRTLMYIPLNTYWVTTYYLKYYKMKENVTNLPTVSTLNTWRASQKKPECDYSPCPGAASSQERCGLGVIWQAAERICQAHTTQCIRFFPSDTYHLLLQLHPLLRLRGGGIGVSPLYQEAWKEWNGAEIGSFVLH